MNSLFGSNIDNVRAEIMRLETAPHFDADAWSRVLADLESAGRVSALADAKRRMETARSNQPAVAAETHEVKCNCVLCRFTDVLNWTTLDEVKTDDLFVGIDIAAGEDRTVRFRGNGKSTFHAEAVETGYNADGRLKAYWVQCRDDEWGMWIHAESAGKAKSIYLQQDPSLEPTNFTDLRATRPGRGADLLDCTPFTDDTLKLAGYPRNVDIDDFPEAFLDFCPCSMCRYELTKPEYRIAKAEA